MSIEFKRGHASRFKALELTKLIPSKVMFVDRFFNILIPMEFVDNEVAKKGWKPLSATGAMFVCVKPSIGRVKKLVKYPRSTKFRALHNLNFLNIGWEPPAASSDTETLWNYKTQAYEEHVIVQTDMRSYDSVGVVEIDIDPGTIEAAFSSE